MNQSKKTNGWILCPSKSFPGKFYYFNVLNGEAAWSLDEVESKTPKRGFNIQTVTDRAHTYPEPSSPPIDASSNTSSCSIILKKPTFTHLPPRVITNPQAQMFGQAGFPKYMPNIVWTPIEYPMFAQNAMVPQPMLGQTPMMGQGAMLPQTSMMGQAPMLAQTPMFMPNTENKTFNRKSMDSDPDRLLVQTCNIPLSKRFQSYTKNCRDNKPFNKFYEANYNGKEHVKLMTNRKLFGSHEMIKEKSERFLKEPIFRRQTENGISKSNSLESLLNSDYIALQKSSSQQKQASDFRNQNDIFETSKEKTKDWYNSGKEVQKDSSVKDLDKSDLRYFIVAKRRKSVDSGEIGGISAGPSKKIKTFREDQSRSKSNKRVTFDLGVESEGSFEDEEMLPELCEDPPQCDDNTDTDRLLYVVADFETLLDELQCIEEFVQSDDKRRILISYELRSEIEAASLGDCGGRQRVIVARQVARKIVAPPQYYVILPQIEEGHDSSRMEKYTLDCCLDIMNSDDDVVLITNNSQLYDEAKSLNITCYNTKEIKNGDATKKPEVSFVFKRIQSLNKDKILPNTDKNIPKSFDTSNANGKDQNSYKKSIFDEDFVYQKKNMKDANTSPIDCEKMTKLTKNIKENIENAKTVEEGIKNLFIKEKSIKERDRPITENLSGEKEKGVRFDNIRIDKKKIDSTVTNVSINYNKDNILDEILNECVIKNKEIEDMIQLKMEELTCVLTQIMEDCLNDIIIKYSSIDDILTPPWFLYESTKKIQDLYDSREVKLLTEKFKGLLVKESNKIGKLKSSIKPNDFIKIVGCGIMLIQSLKAIHPEYEDLSEAESSLNKLLQSSLQPVEEETPAFQTPVLKRCDVEQPGDNRHNFVKKRCDIIKYLKDHYPEWRNAEIAEDLEANQDDLKILRTFGRNLNLLNIDSSKTITLKKTEITHGNTSLENKIIFEKDNPTASNLKDNCENRPKPSSFMSSHGNNKEPLVVTRNFDFGSKVIRKMNENFVQENIATPIDVDDLNIPKHGNTFNQETAGPKVIRKFENLFLTKPNSASFDGFKMTKIDNKTNAQNTVNNDVFFQTAGSEIVKSAQPIVPFEDKMNTKPNTVDVDALDYSPIYEISDSGTVSFVYKINDINKKIINKNDIIAEINDNALDNDIQNYNFRAPNNYKANTTFIDDSLNNDIPSVSALNNDSLVSNVALVNDGVIVINDSASDSGFENESICAYSFVRKFLCEISGCLKAIHQFVDRAVMEFREEDLREDNRRILKHRACTVHLHLAEIIHNLKRIIERESNDASTLKEMVIKAGVQASTDKRMTRYRQVMMKCLEQGMMLETAVKMMINLGDDELDSLSTVSAISGNRYINIFE